MQEVYNQLFCLLIFTATGIVIGTLFDIFRILRKSFKTADWITYLQDILFWILAGCIMLFSIFTFNNGEIRSYVFIGMILGIIIYMLTISRFFVKSAVSIIKFIKKILSYPIKLIKNILMKIIIKPINTLFKKGKSTSKNIYNKLQKLPKSNNNFENSKCIKSNKHKILERLNKKDYNFTIASKKCDRKRKKIKEKEGILQKM